MKIVLVGDPHRTFAAPINRKDNYEYAVKRKSQWIIDYAINNSCSYIIYPGDVFDSHKVPYAVVEHFLQQERAACSSPNFIAPVALYVFGQHDQRYHTSEKKNTPLGTLLAGTEGILLTATPYIDHARNTAFYGASWGETIPEIQTQDMHNILVMHRMVIGDKKLWEEQEDYITSDSLLKTTGFDLIVAGDNHQRVLKWDIRKRAVVNMGSVMRSTIAQITHTPAIAVYDTSTKNIEIVDIPCDPAHMVFCAEKVAQEKERDSKVEDFVRTLQYASENGLDFTKNLARFIKDNSVEQEVKDIIGKMLPEITKLEV